MRGRAVGRVGNCRYRDMRRDLVRPPCLALLGVPPDPVKIPSLSGDLVLGEGEGVARGKESGEKVVSSG